MDTSIRAVAVRADHRAFARAALDRAVQQITAIVPPDPQAGIDASTLARLASIWGELWRAIEGRPGGRSSRTRVAGRSVAQET